MSLRWKIGDWLQVGVVRYMVYRDDDAIHAVSGCGKTIYFEPHWPEAIRLPRCDGWDWQPKPKLQIREGAYYALANNAIVGPMIDDRGKRWYCGADVWERDGKNSIVGAHAKRNIVREVPKPEPVYRPFASGEEFEPHRDRWLLEKCNDKGTRRFRIQIAAYSDAGIWLGGAQVATKYATAFNLFAFEDGTPFGVEVTK